MSPIPAVKKPRRGRPKGYVVAGSRNAQLMRLEVGESFVVETTLAGFTDEQRVWSGVARARRPAVMAGRRWTSALYTGVGTKAGDVRYFVRVERVA